MTLFLLQIFDEAHHRLILLCITSCISSSKAALCVVVFSRDSHWDFYHHVAATEPKCLPHELLRRYTQNRIERYPKKIGISEASKWRNFWRTFPHHSALKTRPSLDFVFVSIRRQLFWPLSLKLFLLLQVKDFMVSSFARMYEFVCKNLSLNRKFVMIALFVCFLFSRSQL